MLAALHLQLKEACTERVNGKSAEVFNLLIVFLRITHVTFLLVLLTFRFVSCAHRCACWGFDRLNGCVRACGRFGDRCVRARLV